MLYNINICSLELKWGGNNFNVTRYQDKVNMNNSVKLRWFIMYKIVEQMSDYLFLILSSQIK